jgi:hypothetical protein
MEGPGFDNGFQSVDQMLRVYPAFLFGTPLGISALFTSAIIIVLTFVGERIKWIWIALVIYITSLGTALANTGNGFVLANNLLSPFDQLRSLNRPAAIFLLFMLTVRALFSPAGARRNGVGGATWAFFAFEIVGCLLLLSGSTSRGIFGIVVFSLVFTSLAIGPHRWLAGPQQAYSALRAVLAVSILLILGIACHLLIRPLSMYLAGRLTGTTGNPQFLGAFLAFGLPTCYGLLLKRDEPVPWRIAAAGGLGMSVAFILMSGSRAAVIVSIFGVIVFFRRRLGQFLLASLVAVGVLLVGIQLLGIGDSISSHLFSTDNSRAEAWRRLWQEFLSRPLIGVGTESAAGESSYLSVLAQYGLIGSIPFFIAIWLMLRDSVRIVRKRGQFAFGKHAILADVAVATLIEILVSGVFDNHLMATLSPAVFLIYLFLAIYAFLLDPGAFTQAPDGFGDGLQVGADCFGEVLDADGFAPAPHAGSLGGRPHHGAQF